MLKSYKEWAQYPYNATVDGEPFDFKNLMQAENQLHWFAKQIEEKFGSDEKFQSVKQIAHQIHVLADQLGSHNLRHVQHGIT